MPDFSSVLRDRFYIMGKQRIFNGIIALLNVALFLPLVSPLAKASFELPSLPGSKHADAASTQPPPQPVPENIRLGIGETVKIPLGIYGAPAGGARFLIRTKPRHGKLSAVRQVNENSAYVTYTHDGKLTATSDQFTYAAQSDNGVSAAATVALHIADAAPKFIAPTSLDFGKVFVGKTVTKTVLLQNKGGGVITGKASVDAPWKIDGAGSFSLARKGGRQVLKISVTPDHPGLIRQTLRYSNDLQHPTGISVTAVSLFKIADSLELKANTKTGGREGSMEITNATAQPLTITVSANDPLSAPAEITLSAHQKSKLKISSKSQGKINSSVSLMANGSMKQIAVHATASPVSLEASSGEIELGTAAVRETKNSTFILKNSGGVSAEISTKIAAPFSLTASDAHFKLAAGASRKITVSAAADSPGEFHAVLKISDAIHKSLKIQIPAKIRITAASAAPTASSIASTPRQNQTATQNSTAPTPSEISQNAQQSQQSPQDNILSILPIRNFHLNTITRTSCELAWEIPANNKAIHYSIENATPHLDTNGEMNLVWKKLQNTVIEKNKRKMTAKLTGLIPGRPYVLRVAAENPDTGATEFTPEVIIHTLPPWKLKITMLRVLLVALILIIAFIIYRKWRNR